MPPPVSVTLAYSTMSERSSAISTLAGALPRFTTSRVYIILSEALAVVVEALTLPWVIFTADLVCITLAEHFSSFIHNVGSPGQGWHSGLSFVSFGFCGHISGAGTLNVFTQLLSVLSPSDVLTVSSTVYDPCALVVYVYESVVLFDFTVSVLTTTPSFLMVYTYPVTVAPLAMLLVADI